MPTTLPLFYNYPTRKTYTTPYIDAAYLIYHC